MIDHIHSSFAFFYECEECMTALAEMEEEQGVDTQHNV